MTLEKAARSESLLLILLGTVFGFIMPMPLLIGITGVLVFLTIYSFDESKELAEGSEEQFGRLTAFLRFLCLVLPMWIMQIFL